MSNGFIKKTGQTAVDEAKKTARQIAREPVEILKKTLPSHLTEGGNKDTSSLVSEMVENGNKYPEKTDISEEALNSQTKKRIQELEDEIKKMREKRKADKEAWEKNQEALMQDRKKQEEQFVESQSKKKRGFMGFMKKKQGTKEMGKQASG